MASKIEFGLDTQPQVKPNMNDHLILSRRQALAAATSGILITSVANPLLGQQLQNVASAEQETKVRKKQEDKDIIFRTTDPRNGEPELNKLVQSWLTPTKHFYVRSHAPNPILDPNAFQLRIEGAVRKPVTLSLGELAKFKRHKLTATLTCAGNRRTEYNEEGKVGGVQWEAGAIGNAKWSGFSLADVLKEAEVLESAQHVWFEGLDKIKKGDKIIPFGGSVPIEKAMLTSGQMPGVLLADAMNEAPLTADHGYPLRTVVPGYIGARSVKWLGRIVVSDRPSPNHYVATAYKVVKNTKAIDWREAGPIYRFPINAAICTPSSGKAFKTGAKVEVSGYSLPTGREDSVIKNVLLSTDGKTWKKAEMQGEASPFCWQLWKAKIAVGPKTKFIMARALDSTGGFMPYRVPWNAKGYLQNSWHQVPVEVS